MAVTPDSELRVLREPVRDQPVELLDGYGSPGRHLAVEPFKVGEPSAALNLEQRYVPGVVVANPLGDLVIAGLQLSELQVVGSRMEARTPPSDDRGQYWYSGSAGSGMDAVTLAYRA